MISFNFLYHLGMFLGYSLFQLLDYCITGIALVRRYLKLNKTGMESNASAGSKRRASSVEASTPINIDEKNAENKDKIIELHDFCDQQPQFENQGV